MAEADRDGPLGAAIHQNVELKCPEFDGPNLKLGRGRWRRHQSSSPPIDDFQFEGKTVTPKTRCLSVRATNETRQHIDQSIRIQNTWTKCDCYHGIPRDRGDRHFQGGVRQFTTRSRVRGAMEVEQEPPGQRALSAVAVVIMPYTSTGSSSLPMSCCIDQYL
jgi:hypothetical protein